MQVAGIFSFVNQDCLVWQPSTTDTADAAKNQRILLLCTHKPDNDGCSLGGETQMGNADSGHLLKRNIVRFKEYVTCAVPCL